MNQPRAEAAGGSRRKLRVGLLRAALGAAVLAYLYSQAGSSQVAGALQGLDLPLWLAALCVYLTGQALCAWKWGVLARALNMPRPYRALVAFYAGGMFANLFLPSTIGGDLGRAVAVARPDGTLARGVASVLGDRGSGFFGLVTLAAAASVALPGLPGWLRLAVLGGTLLFFLGGLVALAVPERFRRLGSAIPEMLAAWRRPSVLVPVLLTALVFQGMVALVHVLLGRALGLQLPLGFYVLASTLVAVVAMAPVSINGLGTRDAAYVYLLGLAGVPREDALAFTLSWLAIILIGSALGGLVFATLAPGQMDLFTRKRSEPEAPAAGEGE